MKTKKLFALLGLVTVFALAGCNDQEPDEQPATEYTVTFNSNGGSSVDSKETVNGKVTKPADPTKDYYDFEGWYKDEALSEEFSFDTVLTQATTLYAKWELVDVMSYEDYMAAAAGDAVVISGYIADKQSWWDNKVTMYLVGDDAGEGYFLYEFSCTEEENNSKYAIGKKLVVYGTKTVYADEHEIMGSDIDYTLTKVVDGAMPNKIVDVTSSVATADLLEIQNAKFTATLELVSKSHKGDAPTDDLYFVLKDASGNELSCCIEKYLSPYYETLQAIHQSEEFVAGKLVKVEGYMYWWNGANPHITSIDLNQEDAVYETFMSTADGEEVEVYGFLISRTTYWKGTNLYIAGSQPGEGYYVYEYNCTEEEFNNLPLNPADPLYVKVTGTKASYAGMQEIVDAKVTIVETDKEFSYVNIDDIGAINEAMMSSVFYGEFEVVSFTTTDSNVTVA